MPKIIKRFMVPTSRTDSRITRGVFRTLSHAATMTKCRGLCSFDERDIASDTENLPARYWLVDLVLGNLVRFPVQPITCDPGLAVQPLNCHIRLARTARNVSPTHRCYSFEMPSLG